jgi:hypothetical protein
MEPKASLLPLILNIGSPKENYVHKRCEEVKELSLNMYLFIHKPPKDAIIEKINI